MVLQGIGDNMGNLRLSNIIMFSILILSGFAQATDIHQIEGEDQIFPVIIDGLPPLMCGEEICSLKDRLHESIPSDVKPPVEKNGWWFRHNPWFLQSTKCPNRNG